MRRFYFDNGSSRKRWQVGVKGKSQIVAYGRLTGSLRESRKTFMSAAEAKETTEKLIARKKREGYIEVNPARLNILRAKGRRKATEKQIEALEAQLGHDLPEEYRNFLKTVNGGRPNPDFVQAFVVPDMEAVAVQNLLHVKPAKPEYHQISFQIEAWEDVLDGHVPIAEGDGDAITLSLEPKTFGAVYWWSHEVDEPGHLLASSFDEFLTRIAVADGDDEDDDAEAVSKKPKATVKRLYRLLQHDHTPETIREMIRMVKELGDLSGIEDGKWSYCLFYHPDSPRLLRALLEAGLNPEITSDDGDSLLLQCAGNRACIDLLVERGVRIDRRSGRYLETPLMRAVARCEVDAVTRLLELGANPTVRRLDLHGRTMQPDEQKEIRKIIGKARTRWRKRGGWRKKAAEARARRVAANPDGVEKGPKPTIAKLLKRMNRHYISDECDDIETLEGLIEAVGDLSGIRDGQWPGIRTFESPRVLNALLEAGLNPELLDKKGVPLLGQCVAHPECIELLVERGVDADRSFGKENETALIRAIFDGEADCLEVLLAAGADPTVELDHLAKMFLENSKAKTKVLADAREAWAGKKATKTKKRVPAKRARK